jgi:flavin reductase
VNADTNVRVLDLPSDFLDAMRRLAMTVSIATCADEDGWHGMTVTAVTSVTAEPPAVLVCVNTATPFYARLSASSSFCINPLASHHVQIAQAFGGIVKGARRFETGSWKLTRRTPFLIDAVANFFCRTESITHFGTHGIFIGRVEEVRFAADACPLVYQNGRYVLTSQPYAL